MLQVAVAAGALWFFLWPLVEIAYFYDYWRPESFFPTFQVGYWSYMLEDSMWWFLFGFSVMALAEYAHWKRNQDITDSERKEWIVSMVKGALIIATVLLTMFLLGMNSFLSTIFAAFTWVAYYRTKTPVGTTRKALVFASVATIVALVWNGIVGAFSAGWIHHFYFFRNTPDIIVLGLMPIDDFFWFISVSMVIYMLSAHSSEPGYVRNRK